MIGLLVAAAVAGGGEVCRFPGWLLLSGQEGNLGRGRRILEAEGRKAGDTWGGGV